MLKQGKDTPVPSAEALLAFFAMTLLGVLAGLLIFHAVPPTNHDMIVFILGTISGAITIGGIKKVADNITKPVVKVDAE